ncbi:SH3 domain-containing protein [Desulfosarcina sp.]|uniref:SH3 domain-containing protein n=1 Tax=Desulfosarcina sp. TaxID=2027861 RepID=UPI00356AF343
MNLRKRMRFPLVLAVFLMISGITMAAATKSVQIREGAIRSAPSFMSKIIAKVAYGDLVEAVDNKNGWSRVRRAGVEQSGWIHDSALTHKKIVLTAGPSDVSQGATGDEIALAGKGFNEQVEREFKEKNPQLNFKLIDQMEKIVVSDSQMRQFLEAGRVSPQGGTQQ